MHSGQKGKLLRRELNLLSTLDSDRVQHRRSNITNWAPVGYTGDILQKTPGSSAEPVNALSVCCDLNTEGDRVVFAQQIIPGQARMPDTFSNVGFPMGYVLH